MTSIEIIITHCRVFCSRLLDGDVPEPSPALLRKLSITSISGPTIDAHMSRSALSSLPAFCATKLPEEYMNAPRISSCAICKTEKLLNSSSAFQGVINVALHGL